jgi:hypothetical protein
VVRVLGMPSEEEQAGSGLSTSCASSVLSGPMSSSTDAAVTRHRERACTIRVCLDSHPPPIQSGCACRSDSGLVHVDCLIEKAASQEKYRGTKMWWPLVGVCTGVPVPDVRALAEFHWGDANGAWGGVVVAGVRRGGGERRAACAAPGNLAGCRRHDGEYICQGTRRRRESGGEILCVNRRVLREEHPDTLLLVAAGNLAQSLSDQGKHADHS